MPPRIARRMVVQEVGMMLPDRADNVVLAAPNMRGASRLQRLNTETTDRFRPRSMLGRNGLVDLNNALVLVLPKTDRIGTTRGVATPGFMYMFYTRVAVDGQPSQIT